MSDSFDLDAWIGRYRSILGEHPLGSKGLEALERDLGFALPETFRRVSTVFSGDLLGEMEIFSFDPAAPRPTVGCCTRYLRERGLVAPKDVVLAEPPESLVVWRNADIDGVVMWLDAHDVERVLVRGEEPLTEADEWPDLGSFLESCLIKEEEATFED